MLVQSVKSSVPRPRPVLLAASRQRRLWPLSTPEEPFCLRSLGGRPSPLFRSLQALEATAEFGAPIVILCETASRIGIAEVTRTRPDATIILVPQGVGSGISATLAALHEVANENPAPLVLIPGSFFAHDPVSAFRSLIASIPSDGLKDTAILMATRNFESNTSLCFELSERVPGTSLFTLNSLQIRPDGELAEALNETASLARGSGPAIVAPAQLIEHLGQSYPTLLTACRNALHLSEKGGNTLRPRADFLRLAGRPGVTDLFHSARHKVRAYLGNPDWRTVQTFRDVLFDDFKSISSMPVAVIGFPGHRIIASSDGVLILQLGFEDDVKNGYQDTMQAHNFAENKAKHPVLRFSA
jgi:mannose-1-phosphate guanylyltransferase